MEDVSQFAPILDDVFTTRQKNILIKAIQEANDATFNNATTVVQTLKSQLPFDQTDTVEEIANSLGIDLTDPKQAAKFLNEFLHAINSFPIVDLTLAFHPSYDQIKRIVAWWRKEANPYIILNIKLDKNLIAGATIGYQGTMKDFSLHKVLNTYIDKT